MLKNIFSCVGYGAFDGHGDADQGRIDVTLHAENGIAFNRLQVGMGLQSFTATGFFKADQARAFAKMLLDGAEALEAAQQQAGE